MVPIIAGIVVLVAIGVAVLLLRGKKKPSASAATFRELLGQPAEAPGNDDPEIAALRQNLRVKMLHQEDKIDQAIELEREKNPSGTLAQHMRAAIARWERDNQ